MRSNRAKALVAEDSIYEPTFLCKTPSTSLLSCVGERCLMCTLTNSKLIKG
jgi:hypothetical protein